MYPAYAKWVQSHRDLPIRLNQWCNVVVGAHPSLCAHCPACSLVFPYMSIQRIGSMEVFLQSFGPQYDFWLLTHEIANENGKALSNDHIVFLTVPALGVQASAAVPADSRVPLAGRAQRLCHIWGSSNRGMKSGRPCPVLCVSFALSTLCCFFQLWGMQYVYYRWPFNISL